MLPLADYNTIYAPRGAFLYFSENLETCTIGWVLICEGGVGIGKESPFLFLSEETGLTIPTPGSPHIPRRWRPKPQRTRNDCTRQAKAQEVPKPGQTSTRAGHTRQCAHLDVLHGCTGQIWTVQTLGVWSVSETEQIRTLERHTKTDLKIITFPCMFVACVTLQIH